MSISDLLKRIPDPNELQGRFGEWLTEAYSELFIDGLVLRDIIIDGSDGHTSQIDLILIGSKGLYVVEVKLFDGAKVYGDGTKRTWYYYRGGKKFEIYSPKMQNAKHIEYLKRMLKDFGDVPCFSVITMICEDYKVSNINPSGRIDTVICNSLPSMKEGMRLVSKGCPDVLDKSKQRELFDYIFAHRYDSAQARYEHKKQVIEYKAAIDEKRADNRCPRCGAKLVLRSGKYGSFFGCSNYPKCKFTRKADE